jgi:D-alanyl-D-alanine carboxypeptidase/D-alanyl-D-alanine-endopeptidase (penicillin-binding protein 4)
MNNRVLSTMAAAAGLVLLGGCASARSRVVGQPRPVADTSALRDSLDRARARAADDSERAARAARERDSVEAARRLPGSEYGGRPGSPLALLVDSLISAPEFDGALWGVLVIDSQTGDTLASHNAGAMLLPASNLKLVTSSVALTHLGAAYRFHTLVAARGRVRNGRLAGDLLVVGRGDPSVSDHMQGDAMKPLLAMADSLAAHGVRSISGRVLAAGDAFPGPTLGYAWAWDDFEDDYGAPTDELLFNEGFSTLAVHAGRRVGRKVSVRTEPARTWPHVVVTATARRQSAAGAPLEAVKDTVHGGVRLTGTLPLGDSARLVVTDRDPDKAYIAAFTEALKARGISVRGARLDSSARVDTLFSYASPPLSDVLAAMLLPSQNQIAEMLFKTIGLEGTGVGSGDSSRAVIGRQLAEWGVPAREAVIHDGSGLSRQDYVTPRTLVRVLDAMRRSPEFDALQAALPVAGVSGTLASRMRGTPAQGNAHAKTGSMTAVRSLSGYVTSANGHLIEFTIIGNNFVAPSSAVARVQDAIVSYLAGARVP